MKNVKKLLKQSSAQSGQGLVEYALVLTLVAVVSIVIVGATGTGVKGVYCKVVDGLNQNTGTCDNQDNTPQDQPQEKPKQPTPEPEPIMCDTNGIGEGGLRYYEVYRSTDGGTSWYYLNWQYWPSGNPTCPFAHQFHHK
jgi:Flp pilus assembly pilin Flp